MTINVTFDHLVHYVNHPNQVRNTFEALGFTSIKGGTHPNWGTHNCLCYLQDLRYIEWIGFTDKKVAMTSDNGLIEQIIQDSAIGEGFSQLAFRTDNIAELESSLKQKGLETSGPFNGSRKKDDGTTLSWSMLFIKEGKEDKLRYPFFIQWGDSDYTREKSMKPFMQHKIGVPSLSYIGFAVKNIQEAIEKHCFLFGLNPKTDVQHKEDEYGFYSQISIDDFSLRFYRPTNNELTEFEEKPFICGITGLLVEEHIKINRGSYKLTK